MIAEIIQGDCLEHMQDIKSHTVDLVFADFDIEMMRDWDAKVDFIRVFCYQAERVLKRGGNMVIGDTVLGMLETFDAYSRFTFRNQVVLTINAPMQRDDALKEKHRVLTFFKKCDPDIDWKDKWHSMGTHIDDIWTDIISYGIPYVNEENNVCFPTALNEEVMERVIGLTTEEGDLVVDAMFGSGTTGVVAQRMGRNFIGIEKDMDTVAIAHERVRL